MKCSGYYFDRFDICEAYYVYATNYHQGQYSKEYTIFGRLHKLEFEPSLSIKEYGKKGLTENGEMIYSNLIRRNHKKKCIK
jgi:hypothetical protein